MNTGSVKISVCCCTYNRPVMLGELIQSYLMQTYPAENRELIILDDAGQYGDLRGDGWQIVSFPRRFASLGEKRNACASLASPESEWLVVADDDDIYLPNWIESHAYNFQDGAVWSFGSKAWLAMNNEIVGLWNYQRNTYLMHPGHAFEKKLFWEMGGYPRLAGWEDYFLFQALLKRKIEPRPSLKENDEPFLIYRRFRDQRHMTGIMLERYQNEFVHELPESPLEIGWENDYSAKIALYKERKARNSP